MNKFLIFTKLIWLEIIKIDFQKNRLSKLANVSWRENFSYPLLLFIPGKMVVYDFLKGAQVYIHHDDLDSDLDQESQNTESNKSEQKSHTIVQLMYNQSAQRLIQVFSDQTILMYEVDGNFTCHKQVTHPILMLSFITNLFNIHPFS